MTRIREAFSNIGPFGGLAILIIITIAFIGVLTLISNTNTENIKTVVTQLNESTVQSKQLSNLTSQVRTVQLEDIEEQQNRTAELMPEFFESFNQTDLLVNLSNQVLDSANETKALVSFLSSNFGENSDYLQRENFQYRQANNTSGNLTLLLEKLDNITSASQ